MHGDSPESKIVRVASASRAALAEPNFIIKKDGVFYVAVAVLAYDEREAKTSAQKRGVDLIRGLFEKGEENEIPCVEMSFASAERGVQTDPPGDED